MPKTFRWHIYTNFLFLFKLDDPGCPRMKTGVLPICYSISEEIFTHLPILINL